MPGSNGAAGEKRLRRLLAKQGYSLNAAIEPAKFYATVDGAPGKGVIVGLARALRVRLVHAPVQVIAQLFLKSGGRQGPLVTRRRPTFVLNGKT